MTTPTLAQLAEALDVVRRHHLAQPIMPTLDVFAETIAQSTQDEKIGDAVRAAMDEQFSRRFMVGGVEMANIVRTAIESTGARIVTDPPGKLIGYAAVQPDEPCHDRAIPNWEVLGYWPADDEEGADERAAMDPSARVVVMRLLPKRGPR